MNDVIYDLKESILKIDEANNKTKCLIIKKVDNTLKLYTDAEVRYDKNGGN